MNRARDEGRERLEPGERRAGKGRGREGEATEGGSVGRVSEKAVEMKQGMKMNGGVK